MKKHFALLTIILVILLFSCSGPSSLYEFNLPLSSESAHSRTTELNVLIPKGWFTAEDNEKNKIDLWLIKDDYTATISFIRLNPDNETKKYFGKNELQKLEEISRLNNKIAHQDKYIDLLKNESIEINGRKFRVYQFAGTKYFYRKAVFRYKNYFYECTAAIQSSKNENEIKKVFSIQNSVLQSIK